MSTKRDRIVAAICNVYNALPALPADADHGVRVDAIGAVVDAEDSDMPSVLAELGGAVELARKEYGTSGHSMRLYRATEEALKERCTPPTPALTGAGGKGGGTPPGVPTGGKGKTPLPKNATPILTPGKGKTPSPQNAPTPDTADGGPGASPTGGKGVTPPPLNATPEPTPDTAGGGPDASPTGGKGKTPSPQHATPTLESPPSRDATPIQTPDTTGGGHCTTTPAEGGPETAPRNATPIPPTAAPQDATGTAQPNPHTVPPTTPSRVSPGPAADTSAPAATVEDEGDQIADPAELSDTEDEQTPLPAQGDPVAVTGAETVGVWKPDDTGAGWVWAVHIPANRRYSATDATGPGLTVLRLVQMLEAKDVPLRLILPPETPGGPKPEHCGPLAELIEYSQAEWGWGWTDTGKGKRQRRSAVKVIRATDLADPVLHDPAGGGTTPPVLVWVCSEKPHPALDQWAERPATGSLWDLLTAAGVGADALASPYQWRLDTRAAIGGELRQVKMPHNGVRITVNGYAKQYAVVDHKKQLRGFVVQRGTDATSAFCRFGDPALMELDVIGLLKVLALLANPEIAGVEGPHATNAVVVPQTITHHDAFPPVNTDSTAYFVYIAGPEEEDPRAGRVGVVGDGKSVELKGAAAQALALLCGVQIVAGGSGLLKAAGVMTAGILTVLAAVNTVLPAWGARVQAAGEPPATGTAAPATTAGAGADWLHHYQTCTNQTGTSFSQFDTPPPPVVGGGAAGWDQTCTNQTGTTFTRSDGTVPPPPPAPGSGVIGWSLRDAQPMCSNATGVCFTPRDTASAVDARAGTSVSLKTLSKEEIERVWIHPQQSGEMSPTGRWYIPYIGGVWYGTNAAMEMVVNSILATTSASEAWNQSDQDGRQKLAQAMQENYRKTLRDYTVKRPWFSSAKGLAVYMQYKLHVAWPLLVDEVWSRTGPKRERSYEPKTEFLHYPRDVIASPEFNCATSTPEAMKRVLAVAEEWLPEDLTRGLEPTAASLINFSRSISERCKQLDLSTREGRLLALRYTSAQANMGIMFMVGSLGSPKLKHPEKVAATWDRFVKHLAEIAAIDSTDEMMLAREWESWKGPPRKGRTQRPGAKAGAQRPGRANR